jgi:hypothetical protein
VRLRLPTLSTVGKCGRSKRGPTDGGGGRKEDAGADTFPSGRERQ